MPDTPTFGRYSEIPYDQMTPEQQEGYRSLIETRGQLGGPSKIWVHNPKLAKAAGPLGAHFHPGGYSLSERERCSSDVRSSTGLLSEARRALSRSSRSSGTRPRTRSPSSGVARLQK